MLALFISLRTGVADIAALRAKLETIVVNGVASVSKGKILVGTGSGGTNVQYALPALSSFVIEDIQAGYMRLYRLVRDLLLANPAYTYEELKAAVEQSLEPKYSSRPDFSTGLCR